MSTTRAKLDPLPYPDEATDHIRGPASAPVTVIECGDFKSSFSFGRQHLHEAIDRALSTA